METEEFYDIDLDSEITENEVTLAINKSNPNSAPGSDSINNAFLKNLPPSMIKLVVELFNKILDTGDTPLDWSEAITILIHKKGDKNNLNNYRGISLTNCLGKIFTSILNSRMGQWVETKELIPEFQNGFRKNRSAVDNIFILNTIVQNHIRLPRRKVLVAFVDFKKAFDSLIHSKLLHKLKEIKLSTKIYKIIRNLYVNAKTKVNFQNNYTAEIKILRGLLQGEILSPLLFNLFIADIDDFFQIRGFQGLSLDNTTMVRLLAYADDLTILAESTVHLNKALNILYEYCLENGLEVNVDKTKILTFSKGSLCRNRTKCYYNGQMVEEVNSFNYLGVWFSRKGVFEEATRQAASRARTAAGVVRETLARASNSSFEATLRVYDSTVLSTLLYASPVWSLRYIDLLESSQNYFFKNYFSLKQNTPHYIVRQEFHLQHLATRILRQTLNYINHIHNLDDKNLVKISMKRLLFLDSVPGNIIKYNWISQVKQILDTIDGRTDTIFDSTISNSKINNLVQNYSQLLKRIDSDRINNSSYSTLYKIIHISNNKMLNYLNLGTKLSFNYQKLLAQLRTSGLDGIKITLRGILYKIRTDELCSICNMMEIETLSHIFLRCPIYKAQRDAFLPREFLTVEWRDETNIASILGNTDTDSLKKIYFFVTNILKIRSFIFNQ